MEQKEKKKLWKWLVIAVAFIFFAFMAILPARVIKQIVLFPIYVALFYGVSKIMGKAHLFAMVKGERA